MSPSHQDDALQETLAPFLAAAKPQITKLARLHTDLQREAPTLLAYFGEKEGGGGVEYLFSTILTFAHGLQKAAAEMTRHAVRDEQDKEERRKKEDKATAGSGVSQDTLDAMSRKLDRHEAMLTAVTIKRPPPPPSASPASAAQSTAATSLAPPPVVVAGPARGTMHGRRSIRGTLSRGELDEAIRSIHGGVKRRERDTLGRGGGVRLSKMFLDGGSGVNAGTSASLAGSVRVRGSGVGTGMGVYDSVNMTGGSPAG